MKKLLLMVLIVIALYGDSSSEIINNLKSLCQSSDRQSKYFKINGKGDFGVNITLLNTKGNITGTISKENWEGVQRVLRKQQLMENKDYRECIKELTPLFIKTFVSTNQQNVNQKINKENRIIKKVVPKIKLIEGIEFKLKYCKQDSNNIKCYFNITNTIENDKTVSLFAKGYSFIIDIEGEKYYASTIKFGRHTKSSSISKLMVQDITVPAILSFINIPSNGDKIPLLKFDIQINYASHTLSFRKIPLR